MTGAKRSGALSAEAFLEDYLPLVRDLAHHLRALVKGAVPGVAERVYPGWKLIGYRLTDVPGGRYFAFVAPTADEVRLGFEYGILLTDGDGLLKGEGTQVRYVSVHATSEIDPDRFIPLIREAATVAAAPKPKDWRKR